MLNWIGIVKELGILIPVVIYGIVSSITNTIWKVICDTITMTNMSLVTKLLYLIELRILVEHHNRRTERYGIEQESDNP